MFSKTDTAHTYMDDAPSRTLPPGIYGGPGEGR
jgi:hypothetical protein